MAPKVVRQIFLAGVAATAFAIPMMAAERGAAPAPVVTPDPVVSTPMPAADATHTAFVTWLRTTDLGTMLRRDAGVYTIEDKGHGNTIMRINGGFKHVLVMKMTGASLAEPTCIMSETEADQFFRGNAEAQKP